MHFCFFVNGCKVYNQWGNVVSYHWRISANRLQHWDSSVWCIDSTCLATTREQYRPNKDVSHYWLLYEDHPQTRSEIGESLRDSARLSIGFSRRTIGFDRWNQRVDLETTFKQDNRPIGSNRSHLIVNIVDDRVCINGRRMAKDNSGFFTFTNNTFHWLVQGRLTGMFFCLNKTKEECVSDSRWSRTRASFGIKCTRWKSHHQQDP